jgi:hypothetical protein
MIKKYLVDWEKKCYICAYLSVVGNAWKVQANTTKNKIEKFVKFKENEEKIYFWI